MNFGARTLRYLHGRKIWADRRRLEADDLRGSTRFLLFEPDYLIDPDPGSDAPRVSRPAVSATRNAELGASGLARAASQLGYRYSCQDEDEARICVRLRRLSEQRDAEEDGHRRDAVVHE